MKIHAIIAGLLSVLAILGAPSLGAKDLELANGDLQLNGQDLPGWKVSPSTVALQNEALTGFPGVESALTFTIEDVDSSNGQLVQRVKLAEPGAKLRISGLVQSSVSRAAYLEIKLFAAKQELKRVKSPVSGKQWADVSVEVDTAGVEYIEVLCRWYRQEKYKGAKVGFANIRFTPLGESVALAGDSTMADHGEDSARKGWGKQLPAFLQESVSLSNFAAAGQTAKSFREEGRWKAVLATKPNVVLIQFGQYDSVPDQPGYAEPLEAFPQLLRDYVKEARAAGASPVLVTPVHPRRFAQGKPDPALEPYAAVVRKVAEETQTPLVDLYTLSTARLAELGEEGSRELFCSYKDRNHYSQAGATWVAGLVADGLAKAKPEWNLWKTTSTIPSPAAQP
jgi:lysophospholipase L1-like esterase